MRALLVDDDPSLRMLLQRLLSRELGVDCFEAENGIDALECLRHTPVDLMALDIRMPLMDGVDVLTLLRGSPDYHDLPVVVMSTLADDDTVRKVVSLGISDYLLKPFTTGAIRHRFTHAVKACETKRQRRALKISPSSCVLVVDGDRHYVELLSSLLRDFCEVHTAMDGIDAFKQVVQRNDYAALFIGEELGLLGRDILAARLRAEATTRYIPLVGLGVSEGETNTYDAVLPRTLAPEVARDALTLLLGQSISPKSYLQPGGALTLEACTAVTQTVGMLTQVDLRPASHPEIDDVRRWASASMDLVSSHVGISAEVLCSMAHARLLAGARDGRDVHAVGEDQALGFIGDIVATLAARLTVILGRRGHVVESCPMRWQAISTTGGWPRQERSTALLTTLRSADGAVSLGLRLTWLGGEDERATPACTAAVATQP